MAQHIQILENFRVVMRVATDSKTGIRKARVGLLHKGLPSVFKQVNVQPHTKEDAQRGFEDFNIPVYLRAQGLRLLAEHWGFKISIREWPEDRSR